MNENKLFYLNRLRLAVWYSAVMSGILALCSLGIYRAMSLTYWDALDRELNSVAGTLHDSIEVKLQEPGQLEPSVRRILPDLCTADSACGQDRGDRYHILGATSESYYYVRLFDNSGRLVAATASDPRPNATFQPERWQTIKSDRSQLYRQISLVLHTQDNRDWGYIQIGRSFQDAEVHLGHLRWILGIGLPIAIFLIAAASWRLAGLAMRPIYQSYRQIQQFTADAAHELRTPLAAIQATVESALLMPQMDESDTHNLLQTLSRQNRRVAQLVADLLLLSRLEQAAIANYRPCNLDDIASDLVEELAALAMASEIELEWEKRSPQPLTVKGDEEQLYRLVSNLIVNGIRYTQNGGKVRVILERQGETAILQVRDTGIGIAEAEQSRIFDRFYRVNSDRSRQTGGAGLGLSIALAIVKAHQGKLEVRSILDKGSTFTLQLPLAVR